MRQFLFGGLRWASVLVALAAFQAQAEPLIVEHVTLIDGTGRAPQTDMTVVIDRERFQSVGPSALNAQTAGQRVDGRGKF
jgi:N-acyl-D-aspartate/D-glutamate deacylase